MVPDERMAFAINAGGGGPGEGLLGALIIGMAALCFVGSPIERQGAVVEQRGELAAIEFFLFGIGTAAELEEITAEAELMTLLLERERGIPQGAPGGVAEGNGYRSFSVLFDAARTVRKNFLVGRFCGAGEQGGRIDCESSGTHSGFEESASIHLGSKQYLKILASLFDWVNRRRENREKLNVTGCFGWETG